MTQTTRYDFDNLIDRRQTLSTKWNLHPEDVLPMWVADMDFQAPPAVVDALHKSVDEGIFGYAMPPHGLIDTLVVRMQTRFNWTIQPEDIVLIPGVIPGISMLARAVAQDGAMLIQPPVYFPFHFLPQWNTCAKQEAPLKFVDKGDQFTYEIDVDDFAAAFDDSTRMFLLCNPHNPVGRVWSREELEQMAAVCAEKDVYICSDEIHNDLILEGYEHIPIASVSEDAAQRTVTLMAPSKTFNMPGLHFSFAIIQNPELRQRFVQVGAGMNLFIMGERSHSMMNTLGYVAADAAYRDGDDWLQAVMAYIKDNRDFAYDYLAEHMPQIKPATLEGTYLLWMDCRALDLPEAPGDWFLKHAKVAFNEGGSFGAGGEGFVRMNLATSRARLEDGLNRMCEALKAR